MTEEESLSEESHLLETWQRKSVNGFEKQVQRVKRQDWWTFSKIGLVFSFLLMLISAFLMSILLIEDILRGADVPMLLSIISIIIGLAQSTILLFVVATMFLGVIAFVVSIATGNDEVMQIGNKGHRYVAHFGKIVLGFSMLWGIYELFLKDVYGGVVEFYAIIFGLTGFFLLPISLIVWGCAGILKEKDFI